jgi:very-short-patch-repair endonuclease
MRAELDVVVGQVRRTGWHRVGFGLYRRDTDLDAHRCDLLAWSQILPTSAALTHLTAAALHGLWLPPLPDDLPVLVSMSKQQTRPKRPELKVMRHTQPIRTTRVRGLRVATVEEVLLVCARDLAMLDLVVLGDSALQAGLTDREQLLAAGRRRRWGAAALTRAVGWMDGRSESPWESLLRVFHRMCGIPVEPQHVVTDAAGGFVARGDLWLTGSRMLHEYDGAVHRDRHSHVQDLHRDRRLLSSGWNRRGYTAQDLMRTPESILRDADETLGRRHRVDRLDPWLTAVSESLFSAEGRDRLAVRLGLPASGPSRRSDAG